VLSEMPLILDFLSPMDIADIFLLAMSRRSYNSLIIEPGEAAHSVTIEPTGASLCQPLPPELGDAVIARLCLIAGVPVAAPSAQFGRIQANNQDVEVDLFFGVRPTPNGLSAEIWRLSTNAEVNSTDGASIDQYDLLGELGSGGMGVVYRAIHKPLSRTVAIKILHERFSQDALALKRFVREARAASKLNHAGIVAVYDFGITHSGRSFLVMELVEGSSLRALLQSPFTPIRAVRIMQQLLTAIHAVHEVGIIHRDLKPENIFVAADDHVKIGDFGAAKDNSNLTLSNITQPGLIFGTPSYMSPEHIQGWPTDHRTDLYALGCIFFELITGKPPYRGKSAVEVFNLHVTCPLPKIESSIEALPPIFTQIIEVALAKDDDERYQNALEFRADLERAEASLLRNTIRSGWRRWLTKAE
jgi:serine/threonine protein kinase